MVSNMQWIPTYVEEGDWSSQLILRNRWPVADLICVLELRKLVQSRCISRIADCSDTCLVGWKISSAYTVGMPRHRVRSPTELCQATVGGCRGGAFGDCVMLCTRNWSGLVTVRADMSRCSSWGVWDPGVGYWADWVSELSCWWDPPWIHRYISISGPLPCLARSRSRMR